MMLLARRQDPFCHLPDLTLHQANAMRSQMDDVRKRLLSFRMISDTRIEYRNANSRRETARFRPTGSYGGGVKPRGTGSVGGGGFLGSLPQCGPHLPSLRHQPPDVLSLATAL